MQLSEHAYTLPLHYPFAGQTATLHLGLILDPRHGPTLIDSGMPGSLGAIAAALEDLGLRLRELRRLVLTHQDLDHVGSAADVVRESGAEVLAHRADTAYIEGRLPLLKPMPQAALERMPPQARAVFETAPEPVRVDRPLEGGERLDLAGGTRVIFTPGHTPGHLCLYLERARILFTADALNVHGGQLALPYPPVTPDMDEAVRSISRLADLEVDTLVSYHGGVTHGDLPARLRALAAGYTPA
ncbi:glyoxylase-like metal-dependent hydrolase (beta-lactamase superfamily II) [Deinobacterium chartae]|uniref:Glyoxylase-like metal-dependent hydrolase (Beta-lactamase superfamily II) n=1 Tax=Deinobacterium chartae TaxID=521158 RepID=A0A841I085_9DEIO|nr:MBL fold metallo-hydrolase [Deinobacterium chartae]MBB6098603.1 glyoxylase-like metal-dependent hydrolase (beta-lactamase superfamily II) [Deinobacterium chartae]